MNRIRIQLLYPHHDKVYTFALEDVENLESYPNEIIRIRFKKEQEMCGQKSLGHDFKGIVSFYECSMKKTMSDAEEWFMNKFDVDEERMKMVEHNGEDVCYFIEQFINDPNRKE